MVDPVWYSGEAVSSEDVGMLRHIAVSMEAGSAHEVRAATDASSLPVPPPQASYPVPGFRSKPCSLDSGHSLSMAWCLCTTQCWSFHEQLLLPCLGSEQVKSGTGKKSGW